MLRSLTAPLYHTLTTTQRLHITVTAMVCEPPIYPIIRRPGISSLKNINKCFFLFFFNKPGNKCITDAVIMDVGMSACEPTLSVHTTNPRAGLCFIC